MRCREKTPASCRRGRACDRQVRTSSPLEASINIFGAFPTPLGLVSLGRDLTEAERSFLLNLPLGPHRGAGATGSSLNSRVLDDPILGNLREFITASLRHYFDETFKPATNVSLKITQSWTNYAQPGQFHSKHNHPNSLVSGVFYVSAQKEEDSIFFFKDAYERLVIPAREINAFTSSISRVPVGTGELVLFPSALPHGVEPTTSKKTRVSLSFNSFPEGVLGDERMLAGLTLSTVR